MIDRCCHGRESNGILYVWKGEATFCADRGKTVVVRNGEVAFLPKHKRYRTEYTAESTTFVVVNFELFDKAGGEVLDRGV